MIVGLGDFRMGLTLKERVATEDARRLREVAGWDISTGPAIPDNLPTRYSTTALGGTIPAQVPICFRTESGLRIICRDADEKIRVLGTDGTWGAAQDSMQVVADNTPFRLGPLLVFAEDGANAQLSCFEPDSPSTTKRPLSFRGPLYYNATARPTVSSSALSGTQLFDTETGVPAGATAWAVAGAYDGISIDNSATDEVVFNFDEDMPAVTSLFTKSLGTVGVSLTNMEYFIFDIQIDNDPQAHYGYTGKFANDGTIVPSGYCITFYSDTGCTTVIKTFSIPQVLPMGQKGRVAINIKNLGGTVKGLGFGWDPSFVHGAYDNQTWTVRLWSQDFEDDWSHFGNFLMPAITFAASPFASTLPPYMDGSLSAVVWQTFGASDQGSAGFPKARYSYCFRGRDALSIDEHREMISNPSLEAEAVQADPWRTQELTITLPTLGDDDVMDQYGDYVTHILVYRSLYDDLAEDEDTGEVGIWSWPEFVGSKPIAASTTYTDAGGEDVACTMAAGTNIVTSTAHGLNSGNVISFDTTVGGVSADQFYYVVGVPSDDTFFFSEELGGTRRQCVMTASTNVVTRIAHGYAVNQPIVFRNTVGGVTVGTIYYVKTVPDANSFTFSTSVGGAEFDITANGANWVGKVFDITADGSNAWTLEEPVYELWGYPVPQYQEANHDDLDSALYAVVADQRVYAGKLGYHHATTTWERALHVRVSNKDDYCSFPTTPSEDSEATDGEELGEFAPHAFTVRGLVVKDTVKYLFTDNGFWELVGDNARTGWGWLRRDSIGAVSGRTAVDCRSQIIWHGPDDTYFYRYTGTRAEPISKGILDSSLIDWTVAHGFGFAKERYVGFCNYADTAESTNWCLVVYDIATGGWRRRHSTSYQLAGLCVDEATGDVYGLTHDGDMVKVFGGTTDYGGAAATYTLGTQFMKVADPGQARSTRHLVLEALTDQASIDLTISVYSQGRKDDSDTSRTLSITSTQSYYGAGDFNVKLTGDAVRVLLSYTGAYPPDVYFLGVALNDTPEEA